MVGCWFLQGLLEPQLVNVGVAGLAEHEMVSVEIGEGALATRRYACRACGRSFKKKDHVKEHFRMHTGEKPFMCPLCLKRFTRGRTLKTHVAITHPQAHI
ncbi:putative zinc finger E-box-binding homeobox 2 isoform X2 [Penaeus vannamei]|uniref:Putative zinc finger E-box-binding homeobox 2 isoform X2 n=1 Tax=Penaeus vannamei TaxID=6689 RepID=A0A3R7LYU8_PENVA|nr:putative zinc finger E-box-binding homeobox 2 isoform X2 [Penaeus vannamei]